MLLDPSRLPSPAPWESSGAASTVRLEPVKAGAHPCQDCLAPCCWWIHYSRGQIVTVEDLDEVGRLLLYQRFVARLGNKGSFAMAVISACRFLDQATCRCSVHGTDQQPPTCKQYNAHTCWYRRVLEAPRPNVVTIDATTWEDYRNRISVGPSGLVMGLPGKSTFERRDISFDKRIVYSTTICPPKETTIAVGEYLYFMSNFEHLQVRRSARDWHQGFTTYVASHGKDVDSPSRPNAEDGLTLTREQVWGLLSSMGARYASLSLSELRDLVERQPPVHST